MLPLLQILGGTILIAHGLKALGDHGDKVLTRTENSDKRENVTAKSVPAKKAVEAEPVKTETEKAADSIQQIEENDNDA